MTDAASQTIDEVSQLKAALGDNDEFWQEVRQAMLWRGHDRHGSPLKQACRCHACDLVTRAEKILKDAGLDVCEYT